MESLYRKYRPLTFESVVGQQHIVSTLEHAVAEGRLSHAYLFCGPRGTGKTTMARILAKALLCEKAEGAARRVRPAATPTVPALSARRSPRARIRMFTSSTPRLARVWTMCARRSSTQ